MKSSFRIDFEKYKPLPVGNSGWADFSQKCYTVDKTLLVKDLIDDQTTVALFTRPRRFGKTTALQMIKAFFEKAPKDNLKKMTTFMRQFLSGAMKDNNHVRMGIMTGVLRVAKEGILSGLNNPKVWTVFSKRYSQYFGFTEDEVRAMTRFYGVPEKMSEIKDWYDGYYFGGMEIYNPWSVLGYFDNDCEAKPYWLDTSSNDIITEIVRDLPHDTAETLEQLLRDGRARVPMTEELGPYAEIRNRPETLYALLVSSGYLKTVSPGEGDVLPQKMAYVAIPNREVQMVFVNDVIDKVRRFTGKSESNDIALAICDRDPQAFRDAIQRFLTASVSYFDNSEAFYHGMTLGFLAVLRDRYKVESNCESGEGRFDIALMPLIPDFPGVIVEVKAAKNKAANLKRLAQAAHKQIDAKGYAAKMTSAGVTGILKLGLAYYKKKVEVAS